MGQIAIPAPWMSCRVARILSFAALVTLSTRAQLPRFSWISPAPFPDSLQRRLEWQYPDVESSQEGIGSREMLKPTPWATGRRMLGYAEQAWRNRPKRDTVQSLKPGSVGPCPIPSARNCWSGLGMHWLRPGSFALAALVFAGSLHLSGQAHPADPPEREYTDEQEEAIERVDQLSERLRSIPSTGGVVSALSRLGTAACQHDNDLGIRVFERAYWVAAGTDFDLNEESSILVLSTLAQAASRCHPEFKLRSPTGHGEVPKPKAWTSLRATLTAARTNPAAAVGFARDLAESYSDLDNFGQLALVSTLIRLRQERPAEADAVFQHALLNVATSGSVPGLFTLGNYVFGPRDIEPGSDAVTVTPFPSEGDVYGFSETRPGIPGKLANLYLASSTEILARKVELPREGLLAFGLTKQLVSWSETHAPNQAPILAGLLGAQRERLDQDQRLPTLEARVQSFSGRPSGGLEEEIESAPDEPTKARLRFDLAGARIREGDLDGAREVVEELEDEIRRPLLDIIALADLSESIRKGDLEAARLGLSTLSDQLHLALAALSLSSAHWELSDWSGDRFDQDRQAALETIHLANSVTAQIPEHIRPNLRLAIAGGLALTGEFEAAMAALELAVQEFNTARERQPGREGALSVSVSATGRVLATITRGGRSRVFSLMPSPERITNFPGVVLQLSTSPEPDFDRLEGIVTRTIDPRLRIGGLVAIAEGTLAIAFLRAREPLRGSSDQDDAYGAAPSSPSTDDQAPPK